MPKIQLEMLINAPVERCFGLATSVDLHKISASKTKEQAIDGITSGLVKLDDTVTWRARHFGIWQVMKVKITEFAPPFSFTDEMLSGSFKFMRHRHIFEEIHSGTLMKDTFEFSSPFGIIGKLVDWFFGVLKS